MRLLLFFLPLCIVFQVIEKLNERKTLKLALIAFAQPSPNPSHLLLGKTLHANTPARGELHSFLMLCHKQSSRFSNMKPDPVETTSNVAEQCKKVLLFKYNIQMLSNVKNNYKYNCRTTGGRWGWLCALLQFRVGWWYTAVFTTTCHSAWRISGY